MSLGDVLPGWVPTMLPGLMRVAKPLPCWHYLGVDIDVRSALNDGINIYREGDVTLLGRVLFNLKSLTVSLQNDQYEFFLSTPRMRICYNFKCTACTN